MPGVKLRVVELEVLVQLGRGEEPEFAFGTLNYVHLEPMLTGELAPNGFRGREPDGGSGSYSDLHLPLGDPRGRRSARLAGVPKSARGSTSKS